MRGLGGHWEHKAGLGRILRRAQGSISATGASQALCQSRQCIAVVSLVPLLALSAVPILPCCTQCPSYPCQRSSGTVTHVSLGFLGHWVFLVLLVSPLHLVPCYLPGFLIVPSVPTTICWRATAH